MDNNYELVGACIITVFLIATLSAAISYWFASGQTNRSIRANATLSAGIASGVVAALPIIVLMIENGIDEELAIVGIVLTLGGFIFAALIGFPVAMVIQRKIRVSGESGKNE